MELMKAAGFILISKPVGIYLILVNFMHNLNQHLNGHSWRMVDHPHSIWQVWWHIAVTSWLKWGILQFHLSDYQLYEGFRLEFAND